jgi:hypothetical protein
VPCGPKTKTRRRFLRRQKKKEPLFVRSSVPGGIIMSDLKGLQAITERLEKMELQNRRLKQAGTVILILFAAVLLMGQSLPKRRIIEAERFVLLDTAGKARGLFQMVADGPYLVLLDENGQKVKVELAATRLGPKLSFYDDNGHPRAVLLSTEEGPGLFFKDLNGKRRVAMGVNKVGPILNFLDTDEYPIWHAP